MKNEKYNRTIHLRACPFCGSSPTVDIYQFGPTIIINCPHSCAQVRAETIDEAVERWNTRVKNDAMYQYKERPPYVWRLTRQTKKGKENE